MDEDLLHALLGVLAENEARWRLNRLNASKNGASAPLRRLGRACPPPSPRFSFCGQILASLLAERFFMRGAGGFTVLLRCARPSRARPCLLIFAKYRSAPLTSAEGVSPLPSPQGEAQAPNYVGVPSLMLEQKRKAPREECFCRTCKTAQDPRRSYGVGMV